MTTHLPDKKQLAARLKTLLLILAAYYLATWYIGCPIRYFLGISCPGCGMTRAWLAVLHLDFSQAFYYHPLFFTAPVVAAFFLFEEVFTRPKHRPIPILLVLLYLAVYLIRMRTGPSEIVSFSPSEGLLFRMLRFLFSK